MVVCAVEQFLDLRVGGLALRQREQRVDERAGGFAALALHGNLALAAIGVQTKTVFGNRYRRDTILKRDARLPIAIHVSRARRGEDKQRGQEQSESVQRGLHAGAEYAYAATVA